MSLHDLELSPFLISELYKDALVNMKSSEAIEETPSIKRKPLQDPSGFIPADTAALGLPPVTAKPPAAANETPLAQQQPEPKRPQKSAEQPEKPIPRKPEEQPGKQKPPTPSTIKFLGGNNKKIAFVVNCKTDVYLPEKHLDWLGKMLEACKLNLGDVAIINIANSPTTITAIKNELQSTTVILLGAEPFSIQLPLNFPPFNLQSYADTMFLHTPPPDELNQPTNEAKLLKSKLWVCLQKLFKL